MKIGKERGFKKLLTSCEKGLDSPYDFYINYGFKEDGKDYVFWFKLEKDRNNAELFLDEIMENGIPKMRI